MQQVALWCTGGYTTDHVQSSFTGSPRDVPENTFLGGLDMMSRAGFVVGLLVMVAGLVAAGGFVLRRRRALLR